jgi:hypothetical protein
MNSTLYLSKWGRKLGKQLMKPIQKKKTEYDFGHWNIVTGDWVSIFIFIYIYIYIQMLINIFLIYVGTCYSRTSNRTTR